MHGKTKETLRETDRPSHGHIEVQGKTREAHSEADRLRQRHNPEVRGKTRERRGVRD